MMSTQPFVIERIYNASAQAVWEAITDNAKMKQWYFDILDFKPIVGFEFTFTGQNEGKTFVHLCTVTEVIEGSKLSHTWRYDGYEGNSEVTWELFPQGDKTRVVLTHTGLETFPPLKDFMKENFDAGWTEILGNLLRNYVEKQAAQ
ncbi:SRPBCC family protein [Mucilaginibacter sp. SP1R1]|uniref:SRPBCC family protein n=1 Tax=Mucilaginibacter sp. SP1R1 TaxID=2723091 RepID=UPI0018057DB7|nr:SRPBCC domain-containing protein [Mucilaginibacter sp. SP1R1]MBB6149767.1 uncharacterized protein YndB with AHSA1/START domain [Mucilaginibacter sp. SP1R1]